MSHNVFVFSFSEGRKREGKQKKKNGWERWKAGEGMEAEACQTMM